MESLAPLCRHVSASLKDMNAHYGDILVDQSGDETIDVDEVLAEFKRKRDIFKAFEDEVVVKKPASRVWIFWVIILSVALLFTFYNQNGEFGIQAIFTFRQQLLDIIN